MAQIVPTSPTAVLLTEIQLNVDSDAYSNHNSELSDNMPLPPEDRFGSEQELQDTIQE